MDNQKTDRKTHPLLRFVFEGALTLAAAWLIYGVSQPIARMSLPTADVQLSLNTDSKSASAATSARRAFPSAQTSQAQKEQLYKTLPALFVSLAIAGWVALMLSRVAGPVTTPICFVAALWVGWMTSTGWHKAWSATQGWSSVTALFVFPIGLSRLARRFGAPWQRARSVSSVFAYPGFVLFSGIGLIWLLDFFASSYPQFWSRDYPLKHVNSVLYAFVVLTLVSACAPTGVRFFIRVATWLEGAGDGTLPSTHRRWRYIVLAIVTATWAFAVFVLYGAGRKSGGNSAAAVGELVRVPLWILLGWMGYRWAELVPRGRRVALVACLAAIAVVGLFWITKEAGQALLNLAVVVFFFSAMLMHWKLKPTFRYGGSTVFCWMLLSMLTVGVYFVGPKVGTHIQQRIDAMQTPFLAYDAYLALLRWFGAEAGVFGFGLGRVPWCGYLNALMQECRGGGVPFQTPSDYSYFGLVGVWGFAGALTTLSLLVCWLLRLIQTTTPGDPSKTQVISSQLLCAWWVGLFGVAILVQIFLTTMGALGAFPLTGVTLPLLSFGMSSALVCAFFIGLTVTEVPNV